MTALLLLLTNLQGSSPYEWKNIEIVGGGFVTGIITHPKQRDLVYARTDIGGAYRWDPKVKRWIPLQDWLTRPDWNLYGVESLAIDPSNPKKVYIAAGTYTNNWGGNGAILRSGDQGRTWKRTDLPFKNGGNEDGRSIGERLVVDPGDSSIIYFGTRHNGLWKSTDSGATWNQVKGFPIQGRTNRIGVGWIQFIPGSGKSKTKTIIAGVCVPGTTLWKSDDFGETWSAIPGQPSKLLPHQAKLNSAGELVLVYSDNPGPNGVTEGAVWKHNVKTGGWKEITPERPEDGNRFGYGGVAIDPNNPSTIMVSTLCRWSRHDTVFRSTDGGSSWISLMDISKRDSSTAPYLKWGRSDAEFGHWIGDVEIDPHNPDRAWYVTGATIWSTDNLRKSDSKQTVNWIPRAHGLEETAVLDLISPTSGAHLVSGLGDIGGFRHDDFTKSPSHGIWTNPTLSNTDDLDFAVSMPNRVIRVGRGNGNQFGAVSNDGGTSWVPFKTNPPQGTGSGFAAISSDGKRIVWSPNGTSPHVTEDFGATWIKCDGAPQSGQVVSDRVNPNTFYIRSKETLYVSNDGGKTFEKGFDKLPSGDAGKTVPVLGKQGHLWSGFFANGLYRSVDGGRTFAKVETIDWVEQVGFGKPKTPNAYPTIFVIGRLKGDPGVFRSTDEGKSWVRINDAKTGFGTMQVIEGDPRVFGRAYVGTNGRGIVVAEPRSK